MFYSDVHFSQMVTARDSVVEEWVQKFQALTAKHQNLQENMEKLQSVNKNLRSSALQARTEAQENANLQKVGLNINPYP
jgi:hypothetical protein